MEVFDLNGLERDNKQGGLYNMFVPTFRSLRGQIGLVYLVSEEKSMRLDLVSQNIYGDTEKMDLLLNLNEMDNPLNIMSSDEIRYVDIENISTYRIQDSELEVVRDELVDVEKQAKIDPNRQKYVEQNFSLVPTVNEIPQDPIVIKDTRIIIGNT